MKHQLEYRHFRYFLAVAEELHFRKAAEKLYISQPGLSRQIRQMEEDLGIRLFERHNRKVQLTSVGQYLHTELTKNLKDLNDILDHSKLISDGIDGNLKFGYVGSAMQVVIPRILPEFKTKHPNAVFSFNEMDNIMQVKALLDRDIDIGFVRLERVPGELDIRPVFEDTFSLVLPESHRLSNSNFENLNQLKDEPFILFDRSYSDSYFEKVMQIFDFSGFTPIISHNTVNASSIYRLVENNFGVSIVPTSLKLGYDMKIKFIELKNIPQRTTLRIVWNRSNTNPILQHFLKLIKFF